MDISLSNRDIERILTGQGIDAEVLAYPELAKKKKLEDLLPITVINYLTRENYGHWCCLFTNGDGIQFFDSYGLEPDEELNWNFPEYFKKKFSEDYPHLLRLMFESGLPINYNPYKFQQKSKGIATCGRHVIVRLCFGHLSDKQYKKVILALCQELSLDPDQVVTMLTS